MAKLPNYNGSIDLISGLRPKNNGTFPLMEAHDVQVTETQRLDDMFSSPESWLPIYNGANEGGAQGGGSSGSGVAVISLVGESGTLTDEQFTQLTTNFPSVLIKLNDVYVLKPERLLDGKYYFQMVGIDEDESGKFVGDINVIVNADKTWQYGEFYIDVPQGGAGGVPQYNLSTVLKVREEVTLDITDTMALFSILSDMNNLLKFQNIGVVIQAEEAEGHQPFIGLDLKPDYVEKALIFSYQGVFYNIDLIVDPVAQAIKGKVMAKSQDKGTGVATIEISQTGASGLLDVDYIYLIEEKFPNVNIRVLGKYIYTALEFDATTNTYKFANVNTSDTQAETKLITVNANTNEWTATQYLADLGGGSGGGKLTVEVNALPTENIDDSKIYLLNTYENIEVYARVAEGAIYTLAQTVQAAFDFVPTIYYQVVTELPTNPTATDLQAFNPVYCYIYNNVPYVYGNAGAGNMWLTISAIMAQQGTTLEDKGRTTDIFAETEAGLYVYYDEVQIAYVYNNGWVRIVPENVGGSGGEKYQKLTLTELQNYLRNTVLGGTLASIVVNYNDLLSSSDETWLTTVMQMIGTGSLAIVKPIISTDNGSMIYSDDLSIFSDNKAVSVNFRIIKDEVDFIKTEIDLTTMQRTTTDLSQYLTDEYFEFYIYK